MGMPASSDRRYGGAAETRLLAFVAAIVCMLVCMSATAAEGSARDSAALRAAGTLRAVSAQQAATESASADGVTLTQDCVPTTIARLQTTRCEVGVVNNSLEDVVVDLDTTTSRNLQIVGAAGATLIDARHAQRADVSLAAFEPGVPAVNPGGLFGYVPLDAFGITPTPIGDEEILNFSVPAFAYAGQRWTTIGVDSNGYIVVGGGSPEDNNCCNLPTGADAARPNNILAPFWTDLDGTGAPGVYLADLTNGVDNWLVVEFRLNVFGTSSSRVFQTWIGLNGVEDITYAYAYPALLADPNGQDFLVGAENGLGQGEMQAVLPTQDLRVSSSASTPGGSVSYTLTIRGQQQGVGTVSTRVQGLSQSLVQQTSIQVVPKKP